LVPCSLGSKGPRFQALWVPGSRGATAQWGQWASVPNSPSSDGHRGQWPEGPGSPRTACRGCRGRFGTKSDWNRKATVLGARSAQRAWHLRPGVLLGRRNRGPRVPVAGGAKVPGNLLAAVPGAGGSDGDWARKSRVPTAESTNGRECRWQEEPRRQGANAPWHQRSKGPMAKGTNSQWRRVPTVNGAPMQRFPGSTVPTQRPRIPANLATPQARSAAGQGARSRPLRAAGDLPGEDPRGGRLVIDRCFNGGNGARNGRGAQRLNSPCAPH
jgi:hypothetical protein